MADFDTAVKRWSGLAWAAGLRFNPIPDGAFDAADRQTLLGRYAGISWGEVEPPAPAPSPPAPAPAFTGISGGGGMSNVPRAKHRATIEAEEWEEAERSRIESEDEMVLDCITALVAAGVI